MDKKQSLSSVLLAAMAVGLSQSPAQAQTPQSLALFCTFTLEGGKVTKEVVDARGSREAVIVALADPDACHLADLNLREAGFELVDTDTTTVKSGGGFQSHITHKYHKF